MDVQTVVPSQPSTTHGQVCDSNVSSDSAVTKLGDENGKRSAVHREIKPSITHKSVHVESNLNVRNSTLKPSESVRCGNRILSIGTAWPRYSIAQTDAAEILSELEITKRWARALPKLYRSSGVDQRGSVVLDSGDSELAVRQSFYSHASTSPNGPSTADRMQMYRQHAPTLAIAACQNAMDKLPGFDAARITHLVTVSCSGFAAPGVDFELIQSLGLSNDVQRTHVGFMGCHAAINAMRVAKAIVESDPTAGVLLCAVEVCSIHQQYTDDPQQLVANALFADGAAAMVLVGTEFLNSTQSTSELTVAGGGMSCWQIQDSASTLIPETTDKMSWHVGDNGFQMTLSPLVPEIIEQSLRPWLCRWLNRNQCNLEDITHWVVHPGGPKILDSVETCLRLSEDSLRDSRLMLRERGNMSSPTVLMILDAMGRPVEQSRAVMLAFGPGLCIEAALLMASESNS